MTWISNEKGEQLPVEAGTIFRLKTEPSIIIHHVGRGNAWFLSCPHLGFDVVDLRTEHFDEAVANAQTAIAYRLASLTARFVPIVADKSEIIFTK